MTVLDEGESTRAFIEVQYYRFEVINRKLVEK